MHWLAMQVMLDGIALKGGEKKSLLRTAAKLNKQKKKFKNREWIKPDFIYNYRQKK